MSTTEQVLSDFIDAWNAGRAAARPRVPRACRPTARARRARRADHGLARGRADARRTTTTRAPRSAPSRSWPAARDRRRGRRAVARSSSRGCAPAPASRSRELAARAGRALLARRRRRGARGRLPGAPGARRARTVARVAPAARRARRPRSASGAGTLPAEGAARRRVRPAAAGGTMFRAAAPGRRWVAGARHRGALSRAAMTPRRPPMDELDRLFIGGPEGYGSAPLRARRAARRRGERFGRRRWAPRPTEAPPSRVAARPEPASAGERSGQVAQDRSRGGRAGRASSSSLAHEVVEAARRSPRAGARPAVRSTSPQPKRNRATSAETPSARRPHESSRSGSAATTASRPARGTRNSAAKRWPGSRAGRRSPAEGRDRVDGARPSWPHHACPSSCASVKRWRADLVAVDPERRRPRRSSSAPASRRATARPRPGCPRRSTVVRRQASGGGRGRSRARRAPRGRAWRPGWSARRHRDARL